MSVRCRWRLVGGRSLRITYWLGDYSAAELEQVYAEDVGCCGSALKANAQTGYDAAIAHETLKGMTATQRVITAHIRSMLSTPVYRPSDQSKSTPIAVLNLDSTSATSETKFDQPAMTELVVKHAGLVGALMW